LFLQQAETIVELPHWGTNKSVNFAGWSRILLTWHCWEQTGTKLSNILITQQ